MVKSEEQRHRQAGPEELGLLGGSGEPLYQAPAYGSQRGSVTQQADPGENRLGSYSWETRHLVIVSVLRQNLEFTNTDLPNEWLHRQKKRSNPPNDKATLSHSSISRPLETNVR
ncbi:hypothetical protein KIL84_010317 [Mauremys mutica]|uniref:Uncharacterized protein n=1 Tax=Mauremys mutica TaxID=74926 RepID=A0A9D3XCP3_9SAUR|nr:hypothetical protein KIL84_010317 [Mauremys mutica]